MKVLDSDQIKELQKETFKKTKKPLRTVGGQRVKGHTPERKKLIPEPKPVSKEQIDNLALIIAGAIQEHSRQVRLGSDSINSVLGTIPSTINKVIEVLPKSAPKSVRKWNITVSERDSRGYIKEVELKAG